MQFHKIISQTNYSRYIIIVMSFKYVNVTVKCITLFNSSNLVITYYYQIKLNNIQNKLKL